MIDYKYNEGNLLQEIKEYIDSTYSQHYAKGSIQSTEVAIDRGRGTGFCMGNVDKYSARYGLKGESPDEWRKDLLKVIHYALIQLYIHDKEYKSKRSNLDQILSDIASIKQDELKRDLNCKY